MAGRADSEICDGAQKKIIEFLQYFAKSLNLFLSYNANNLKPRPTFKLSSFEVQRTTANSRYIIRN